MLKEINVKWLLFLVFVLLFAGIYWWAKEFRQESNSFNKEIISQSSYWTCPMHPQIHEPHDGDCPICHMPLVEIAPDIKDSKQKNTNLASEISDIKSISPSDFQLELAQISTEVIQERNLILTIPLAGVLTSSTTVVFQVYESDLPFLISSTRFTLSSSLYPNKEISGFIISNDQIVDSISRTIRVMGKLDHALVGYPSQSTLFGEAKIKIDKAISVTENAILHAGSFDLVYLQLDDERFKMQKVVLGPKCGNYYQIINGLKGGDIVSSGPNFLFDSESKIKGQSND